MNASDTVATSPYHATTKYSLEKASLPLYIYFYEDTVTTLLVLITHH